MPPVDHFVNWDGKNLMKICLMYRAVDYGFSDIIVYSIYYGCDEFFICIIDGVSVACQHASLVSAGISFYF